ncbi:MAG: RnfH family protein [Pseudomonadales bacterium]|jgi:putative ubiquitin-RnfH superfamily antitoxin RatB of RatAB toxin-antitoxin module|nr:RnfH family protein [Pseudomonadales bacterium]MCC6528955.1 RnfH family protein [Pseudomonadales bacterium]MCP5332981.1 RnfH family protein [Pseudomonadales bacterium]HMU91043.1 RnfH family protein [Pseudomonadales bacterium]HMW15900.1 RnfH family protein [Pseudomonadales bacterium]
MAKGRIRVEVVHALAQRQRLIELEVAEDCTALQAVEQSLITLEFPEIDLDHCRMGIFSQPIEAPAQHRLREADRVEIYRPLRIDAKSRRRQRAAIRKKQRARGRSL